MTTFIARNLFKFAEQDNWDEGCLLGTGQAFEITLTWQGKTPADVIAQVARFVGVEDDPDAIERNACDEIGRVDFAVTEDENGTPLTLRQLEQWKRKEIKAYYCVYTTYIERCERVDLQGE